MRKPAKPGLEPDARIDVENEVRNPVVRDPIGPARAAEPFGASAQDVSGDELNLNDAWLVEHRFRRRATPHVSRGLQRP